MADVFRDEGYGAALKYQPTKGTFAAPSPSTDYLCWLTAAPSYRLQVGVAKPTIMRMTRVAHIEEQDITRRAVIALAGIVDSVEHGLHLMSALGGDVWVTGTPHTHTFKPGKLTGVNPQPLLSGEVISGRMKDDGTWLAERLKDGRLEDLLWTIDLNNGYLLYTGNLVGAYEPSAYVALPTLTPTGVPFSIPELVLARNAGVIAPVSNARIHFTSVARPVNGTPATAGAGPVDVYRHTEGATDVTADMVYDSSVDTNASYEDFKARTNAALTFLATAPGSTHSLSLSLPRVKYDTGAVQTDSDDPQQHVSGDALYNTADGSNAVVVLSNGKSGVYNS